MKKHPDDVVPESEMEKCFGTKKKCNRNCTLKKFCLSEAKEHTEDRRRRKFRETEYNDDVNPEAETAHVKRDYVREQEQADIDEQEAISAIESLDVPARVRRELKEALRRRSEIEEEREGMCEMLNRLGEMFVFDQTGFEVMFFQALSGVNSSQLSKIRGCTKQNTSKKIMRGRKRLTAYRKDHQTGKMNGLELGVYYFVFVRKMSCRKAAEHLGICKTKVWEIEKKLKKQNFAADKKTHVSRVSHVFRKKTDGKPLTSGEETIYQDVIDTKKSIREVSKKYHCPASTVFSLRKRFSLRTKNSDSYFSEAQRNGESGYV